eukprot:10173819-Alexandrium_andersonii.AAC.1
MVLATRALSLRETKLLAVAHEEGVRERPARGDREHMSFGEASAEALRAGLRLTDRDGVAPAGQAGRGGIPAHGGQPSVEPEGSPAPTQDVEQAILLALVQVQQVQER